MFRSITAILLGAAYLAMALGWASPVVYCSAILERCPGGAAEMCGTQGAPDCCSHGENQNSRPDCCVTVSEKGHDWVLASTVKVPDMTMSERLPVTVPSLEKLALFPDVPAISNSPDPPGLAGRSLLIQVSRQLV